MKNFLPLQGLQTKKGALMRPLKYMDCKNEQTPTSFLHKKSVTPVTLSLYTPSTTAASISNCLLIILPTFNVGSHFPVKYSLTLEGLTPKIFARLACVSPISYILNFMTSASFGVPKEKCSSL